MTKPIPAQPLPVYLQIAELLARQIKAGYWREGERMPTEAELAQKEKEGMPTGLTVTHPLTGKAVDVWVGNYVLMSYGDGAVMGVPAHDERDFAFALKYSLPIKPVVAVFSSGKAASTSGTPSSSYASSKSSPGAPNADPASSSKNSVSQQSGSEPIAFDDSIWQDWYAEKGRGVAIHSGKYNGLAFQACVDAVAADLAAAGDDLEAGMDDLDAAASEADLEEPAGAEGSAADLGRGRR